MKNNRTVLGIVCIALALVLCFGVGPLINNVTDGTIEVVRVKSGVVISSGSPITEDKIEIYKGKKTNFTDGTYYTYEAFKSKYIDTSSSEYLGTAYAKCEMTAGEYISVSKVSANNVSSASIFDGLGYDEMAMSVEISSFADGLSGKIENGDIVSLVVFTSDSGSTIPMELQYVKVITATTSTGIDQNERTQNDDGTYEIPSTVTLLVNEQQAKAIAQYANRGNITIALRCRGTSSMVETYLKEQAEILGNIGG